MKRLITIAVLLMTFSLQAGNKNLLLDSNLQPVNPTSSDLFAAWSTNSSLSNLLYNFMLTGGGSVTALSATNIAAYQSFLATNGWRTVATNIAAYQAFLATNGFAGGSGVTSQVTNQWRIDSTNAIRQIMSTNLLDGANLKPASVTTNALTVDVQSLLSNAADLSLTNTVGGINSTGVLSSPNIVGGIDGTTNAAGQSPLFVGGPITASGLAPGTYNYGSGPVIMNANLANSATTATTATYVTGNSLKLTNNISGNADTATTAGTISGTIAESQVTSLVSDLAGKASSTATWDYTASITGKPPFATNGAGIAGSQVTGTLPGLTFSGNNTNAPGATWTGGELRTNWSTGKWMSYSNGVSQWGPTNAAATVAIDGAGGKISAKQYGIGGTTYPVEVGSGSVAGIGIYVTSGSIRVDTTSSGIDFAGGKWNFYPTSGASLLTNSPYCWKDNNFHTIIGINVNQSDPNTVEVNDGATFGNLRDLRARSEMLSGTLTATNGCGFPQLTSIPTNAIFTGGFVATASVTNWLQFNLTNYGIILIATNTVNGGYVYQKPTTTPGTL